MLCMFAGAVGMYVIAFDTRRDNEELGIKPAPPAVMASGIYAGLTLPDSGTPMLLLDCGGLADAAGFAFTRDLAANDDEADDAATNDPGPSALLFLYPDGVRPAVALAAVSRVEPASNDPITQNTN